MHTCIFSDCLGAIQAILRGKIVCDIRHTLINIKHQGNTVIYECIPGHCGIAGNEKVNQIAKSATQNKTILFITSHCQKP